MKNCMDNVSNDRKMHPVQNECSLCDILCLASVKVLVDSLGQGGGVRGELGLAWQTGGLGKRSP